MKIYKDQQLRNKDILFREINIEHLRQLKKWGVQKHSLFEWLSFTTEELGSLSKAISENQYRNGSRLKVFEEAIQTATLCLKIAEMIMASKAEMKNG